MKNKYSFRKAKEKEVNKILDLYNELLDELENKVNYPKWTKGAYPDKEYLQIKAKNNELFILLNDNLLIGSAVLNTDRIDDYKKINWTQKDLNEEEILTIHTFAVKEDLRGKGIGQEFVKKIEDYAIKNGFKSIHLDTIFSNSPAIRFYEKSGYKNLGLAELHYDETDETRFIMFEKDLI